jgi:hypothetical protein
LDYWQGLEDYCFCVNKPRYAKKSYGIKAKIPRLFASDEDVRKVVEVVHKDLGHYGKGTTVDAVKKRL